MHPQKSNLFKLHDRASLSSELTPCYPERNRGIFVMPGLTRHLLMPRRGKERRRKQVKVCPIKEKSRLGSDFWGLASSSLERVVIPSARNPHDDSNAKILFWGSQGIIIVPIPGIKPVCHWLVHTQSQIGYWSRYIRRH